jgi:hypothetical protein
LRPRDGRFVDRTTGHACKLQRAASSAPLLSNVMRAGKRVAGPEAPRAIRERAHANLRALDESHRRLAAPARYPVGMTSGLAALKTDLAAKSTE